MARQNGNGEDEKKHHNEQDVSWVGEMGVKKGKNEEMTEDKKEKGQEWGKSWVGAKMCKAFQNNFLCF